MTNFRFADQYEPNDAAEADDAAADDARSEGQHDGCYACPIGGMFAQAQAISPDAMDHLLNAAQELLSAARIAIDSAEAVIEQQRAARVRPDEPRVRRIDIS